MSEERMIYLDQLLHYGAAYTVHLIQKEQTEEQRWPEESWKETMTFDEGTITSTIEPDASELLQVTIKAEGHHEEWARAHFSYDIELEKVIEWRAY
ncbi:ComG operon protein 7 (ComGG) [Aureibacillus halotolerans]|uniref:ComG operon protein 7 (ComGG) n=2 Tax=Aureibacillus halotolerans TaxID=1508390 RepID=A0A4R6U9L6_9BACI|nr:ComG operon protein 7 (ComGG) [Aureibacillus halotolerans]